MSLRAGFIQLPVPDTDPRTASANVPLAAGCVAAAAVAAGALRREDVFLVPRPLANRGGDAAVVEWAVSSGLDVLGFSVSMWNVERSLQLAARIAARSPRTRIVMGGPEVVPGMPVTLSPAVHAFVCGEGETAFTDYLRDGAPGLRSARALADLSALPNPYLCGILDHVPGEPMYLETLRGCPHGCAYCAYGKAFPRIRRFPADLIPAAFAYARERGVPEVYLMDPTFNASPREGGVLPAIERANSSRIPLHTELRLENLSPEGADLLLAAGFRSVEAGLQSVSPAALAAVGRRWDRRRFLRGARLLADRGIVVKTGVILGLPRETAETFRETMAFVRDAGLLDHAEVYPLSVLPGTPLREKAAAIGLSFMREPPYQILSTDGMREEDVFRAIRETEEEHGIELFTPVLPRFRNDGSGFVTFADLRAAGPRPFAAEDPRRIGAVLTLLLSASGLADREGLAALSARLAAENPSTLVQIVTESDDPADLAALRAVGEAFRGAPGYNERAHYLKEDSQDSFSPRLFRLVSSLRAAGQIADAEEPCDLILRCTPALLSRGERLLEDLPFVLLGKEARPEDREWLVARYAGWEQLLLDAPEI